MVKITTFNDRPVRHVRYIPDGTVMLNLTSGGPTAVLVISACRWPSGWQAAVSVCWKATRRSGPKPDNSPAAVAGDENAADFRSRKQPRISDFSERLTRLFPVPYACGVLSNCRRKRVVRIDCRNLEVVMGKDSPVNGTSALVFRLMSDSWASG